jgi:hypothetical protein
MAMALTARERILTESSLTIACTDQTFHTLMSYTLADVLKTEQVYSLYKVISLDKVTIEGTF